MNKKLKFRHSPLRKVWFSSDWHIYHDPRWPIPLWQKRGFESVAAHTEQAKNKLNELIAPDDILIYLGDGFLNSTPDKTKEFLNSILCKNVYYIWGNHESSTIRIYEEELKKQFPSIQNVEIYPLRYKNVIFCGDKLDIIVNNQLIYCSHFPQRVWDKSHKGSWSLSGHSHLSDPERRPEHPHHKAMDVGWDYKLAPWNFDEISDIMSIRDIVQLDHHNETTN